MNLKIKQILNESLDFGILNEAGLSRVLSRIENRDFAIISAYRNGNSTQQNKKLTRDLLNVLNRHKMGGYVLIGHWQEAPDGVEYGDALPTELTDTVEESILFVKNDELTTEEFVEMCVSVGIKFNQDAVIIGLTYDSTKSQSSRSSTNNPMTVHLYYRNGSNEQIGSQLTIGKIGQAYSQMKSKREVPFVFEGILHPSNNIGKFVFKRKNILYDKSF